MTLGELRSLLMQYLQGTEPFQAFQERFVQSTWNREPEAGEGGGLIASIELLLAEYTGGAWTEAELREKLGNLLSDTFSTLAVQESLVSHSPSG